MTPISPAYTREDLIAMIHQRDALVSALKETVEQLRASANLPVTDEAGREK